MTSQITVSFNNRSVYLVINGKPLQGFGDRLLSEIKKLSPKDVQIKVSAHVVC